MFGVLAPLERFGFSAGLSQHTKWYSNLIDIISKISDCSDESPAQGAVCQNLPVHHSINLLRVHLDTVVSNDMTKYLDLFTEKTKLCLTKVQFLLLQDL